MHAHPHTPNTQQNRVPVKVVTVYRDDAEVNIAKAGENLRLRVSGIEEEDISSGFVACGRKNPVPAVTQFEAQLQVLELLEHKAIFTAGYKAVLHVHSVVEECEITKLVAQIDLKTKEKKKVGGGHCGCVVAVVVVVVVESAMAMYICGRYNTPNNVSYCGSIQNQSGQVCQGQQFGHSAYWCGKADLRRDV